MQVLEVDMSRYQQGWMENRHVCNHMKLPGSVCFLWGEGVENNKSEGHMKKQAEATNQKHMLGSKEWLKKAPKPKGNTT